jgi:signal transduction histidine kinase
MECRGAAQDDHIFLARMWFSTYQTEAGLRLAAVVTDSSEELRDREEFSLQQVLSSSEMMVSALCHEIRNVCGAISMLHGKLRKNPALAADADYLAQGSLIESLLRMAGTELRKTPRASAERVDLVRVLEELRIVIEPALQEEKIEIEWNVPRPPAAVWAEHHALLQVFLNIVKNSVRAMENSPRKVLQVVVSVGEATTVVRVIDSGPGVATPEVLFRPFQPGAQDNGLGLFLSRAFVRSFGGEITHEEPEPGCCFAVRLVNFECGKPPARSYEFPAVASRRSQTVSDESCAPAGNGS